MNVCISTLTDETSFLKDKERRIFKCACWLGIIFLLRKAFLEPLNPCVRTLSLYKVMGKCRSLDHPPYTLYVI